MIPLIAACSGILSIYGFGTYRNAIGIFGLSVFLWCVVIQLLKGVF